MRLIFFVLILLSSATVFAQENPAVLRVAGSDTVMVKPDMAFVVFSVTSRAQEAAHARSENEAQSAATLNALRDHGVAERHIRVVSARVTQEWERRDDRRVRVGFIATQIVMITVADLNHLPEIIDSLFDVDIVQLSGISYDISNRQEVEDEALRRAIANARHKADLMAREIGAHIYGVQRIAEGVEEYRATQGIQLRGAGAPSSSETSLPDAYAPGEITVRAAVTIEYKIADW